MTIQYFGTGLPGQKGFEDGTVAIVGVDVDVNNRKRRSFVTKHVATVDGF